MTFVSTDIDLDKPLFSFETANGTTHWTIRDAFNGIQLFGGIGSGKTSSSGQAIATKLLSNNFGGLVLTAKPDEKELWQKYCRSTGREDDLIIIEPGGPHRFNFLDYESTTGGSAGITENIVDVLKTVIRAGESIQGGKTDDPFWETALDMLIFNVVDLCKISNGRVSIQEMFDVVQTIPKGIEGVTPSDGDPDKPFQQTMEKARGEIYKKIETWLSAMPRNQRQEIENAPDFEQKLLAAIPDARILKFVDQFFVDNFIPLSEKTRSIIDFTFSGFLFRLLREPVYSLFCNGPSTVTPEDSINGKILLINVPVKIYQKVGRDCQLLFKYIWQRAMERRKISPESRPVFLFVDEAQLFIFEHDSEYQATARSSRIATVYISQNLPNYHACLGGAKSEYKVKSFLGTLGTKIFHANADIETNRYASELIGDTFFEDTSTNLTVSKDFSHSKGTSLKLDKMVRPEEFMRLKTGGPLNNYKAEAYIHRQGNVLANGLNHMKVAFSQNLQF